MAKFSIQQIKKNPYRFFLLKLAIFLVIVIALDFAAGSVLRYFYFKQESGLLYRTTYSIEKTTADVLVIGSSRATYHYIPVTFEKELNLTFYNAGHIGSSILYHTAILKSVLTRYTPKIVILDFNANEISKMQYSYDQLSSLQPYYKSHPEIRSTVELRSKFEKLKMWSSIYPYNSSLFTIAIGNTEFNKKRRGDIQGFIPLTKVWNEPLQPDTQTINSDMDNYKIKAYETFIQLCKQSQIKLFIVCSPYFVKSKGENCSLKLAKEIAKRNNIAFFDHSTDTIFTHNQILFTDIDHLNENGAKIFSNMVRDDVSNVLGTLSKETLSALPAGYVKKSKADAKN
ncbi:MAG TPA: hypothetical protein VHO72_15305 [Bacteroidales bacterium]|nr:hypothetical protein [Bacteroidales bacterium]